MKLRIEKAVYGGAGLARQTEGKGAGRAVFVPFTLPGELVEAEAVEKKFGHDEAALLHALEASPHRIEPGCPHFGQCGGCQYQHADYPAQLAIKKAILHETLERAGINEVPEIAVHAAEPWGYRNRIRLRVRDAGGQVEIGYNRRGSHEFLPIQHCPIAAPLLWRAALAFKEIGAEASAAGRWAREAAEVEFFCSGNEEKLQMTVFVPRQRVGGFSELCERLRDVIPELRGAAPSLIAGEAPSRETGRAPSRKTQKTKPLEGWGADGLVYTVAYTAANEDYWVGRGSFFQMNRFLIGEMVDVVTKGRTGQLAWDLYAGVGLFSRALARGFNQVTAVEVAGSELANTFQGPGRKAVAATVVDFLRRSSIQRDRAELVVMDPPRAGVGAEVCALLAKLQPQEMVYVSCDPVTLARDLKLLLDSGYRLAETHLLDMFPQTFHLETVVVLRR